ncbi:hypothetical protein CUN67_07285 [Pantoea cypripedii]|uniref:Uncharacterized protein n=1 Tax=Pantoea cypripedii TaxID=55209 RepID=A0A6B9G1B5_PANCY|nr:hypothetical protein CUN67_07285 [Pantoea cypripedii]
MAADGVATAAAVTEFAPSATSPALPAEAELPMAIASALLALAPVPTATASAPVAAESAPVELAWKYFVP